MFQKEVTDKVTRQCPQTTAFLKRRYRTEILQAKPAHPIRTCFSLAYIRKFVYARYVDLWRRAELGGAAPDPTVLTLSGHRQRLLSVMKTGRPLVSGWILRSAWEEARHFQSSGAV